jgi:hypothetical protein
MQRLAWFLTTGSVLVFLGAPPAGAQPNPESGDPEDAPPAATQLSGARSETGALMFSFLGTAVPVVVGYERIRLANLKSDESAAGALLVLGGLVIGPSLGHFYAGEPGRASFGIGLRVLSLAGLAGAAAVSWENESTGSEALAIGFLGLGSAVVIADIAGAPKSARRHNQKLRENALRLQPVAATGSRGSGLALTVTFD